MDQLQRFIDLVNKTGDKLVVFDRYQPDNSVVILGINDYEELLDNGHSLSDLTEDELADKINNDIAIWKNEQVLSDFSKETQDWPDEIDDWSVPSDLPISEDSSTDEESAEEELNYLYPEPEAVTTFPEDYTTQPSTPEVNDEPEVSLPPITPVTATKPDFESLGDILESKYERSNNWKIPSDRKRLADDKFASRYETIGF